MEKNFYSCTKLNRKNNFLVLKMSEQSFIIDKWKYWDLFSVSIPHAPTTAAEDDQHRQQSWDCSHGNNNRQHHDLGERLMRLIGQTHSQSQSEMQFKGVYKWCGLHWWCKRSRLKMQQKKKRCSRRFAWWDRRTWRFWYPQH